MCTGNSARSILLETILSAIGAGRLTAYSAGSDPVGALHPQSLRLLAELGHDTRHARSKSWDEFGLASAPVMEAVITVCGSAANEVCPMWPGTPVRAHWGLENPALTPEAEWETAFRTAYGIHERRATTLLGLSLEEMEAEKVQDVLTKIGRLP